MEVFDKRRDPLYSITENPAPYDVDTARRVSRIIPADANGSNAVGLHSAAGPTSWKWTSDQHHRCNLFTSCLNLTFRFVNETANPLVTPTLCAPPWNLVGEVISGLEFKINNATVLKIESGQFLPIWTDYMKSTYDLNNLDKHSAVFGPVWFPTDSYFTTLANATPIPATSSAFARHANTIVADGSALNQFHRKSIPLADLLCRLVGLPSNPRNYELIITWNTSADVLEKSALNSVGSAWVTNTELINDDWVMSDIQSVEEVGEKRAAVPDIIPLIVPMCRRMTYTGNGDIIIPSIRNLNSISIFGLCKGVRDNAGSLAGHVYGSNGQSHLWNLASSAANSWVIVSDTETATSIAPPSSVQIEWGSESLTASPVPLRVATNLSLDPTAPYYYANLATGRVGNKTVGNILSYDAFASTMPFLKFTTAGYEAPSRSEARDIIIRMPNATVSATENQTTMYVVIYQYRVIQVNVDGTVREKIE